MLSDAKIRNAKPRDKPFKLNDSSGLYLFVATSGTKSWRFDYQFAGKRGTLTFGKYPHITIRDARDKADDARGRLERGQSPKITTDTITFDDLADQWLKAQRAAWSDRHHRITSTRIKKYLRKPFGHRNPNDITPQEILTEIRKIENRGAIYLAKVINNFMSRILRFGIPEGLVARDTAGEIVGALSAPRPVQHRAKIAAAEIPALIGKMREYDFDQETRDAMLLTILTVARTSETRFAHDDEFEGLDGDNPIWRLPPARMKMRNEHLVPLSPDAVEIVKRRRGRGLLFASNTVSGVISENTMLYGLYRLGYHGRATVHGFRGAFSTAANEAEWNADWVEYCLAHVEEKKSRKAYNSALYLKQRRRLLEWWADVVFGRKPADPSTDGL
ncbi:integrase arm-type DNA-binding domain-containing protein [Sphingopyxis sp. GW247-27LB]|uniref:tyrosine-type recombinase/integrase n=1 Tax=Sphingopyxis sp. GW247-27LB TaxID=2012632 RepID=UPI000BA52B99|nr:integrase arm-type DNA-binding domain-containing protein [Sphingopyxis sp. GW247-27LB]PAL23521.1 integrase [Sphingopyxis sp. GW247-27LB]